MSLLLILSLLLNATWVPMVRHFSPNDYAAGTQNWSVVEQKNGWIYAANNYGLLEFDGSYWRIYGINNSTAVRSVARDTAGTLYVGGTNEFGAFYPNEEGTLTYHCLSDSLPTRYRQFGEVWNIHAADDALYIQTRNYLFICDQQHHTEVIDPGAIIYTSTLVDGNLYLATSRDIYILHGNRLHALRGAELLRNNEITAMIPFQQHNLLIATDFRGVYLYNGEQIQYFPTEADDYLKANQLYTIAASEHCLAFGTVRRGVVLTELDGSHPRFVSRKDGLQNNTVLSICFDAQENIWMGLDNGIDMMPSIAPNMYLHDTETDYGSGYSSCEYNNTLYLGTNQGMYAIDRGFANNNLRLIAGSQGQVWSVAEACGTLFCCHNRGLFTLQANQLQPLQQGDGFWSIKPLSDNEAIAGSYTGFYYLTKNNNHWTIRHLDGFSETSLYYDIDATGHIWLLTSQGVQRLTVAPDKTHITAELMIPQVAAERVYSIAKLHNELWLTADHYCGIVASDGVLREDNTQAELLSGVHRYMLLKEDKTGNIWYLYDDRLKVKPFDTRTQTFQSSREMFYHPNLLIGGFANISFIYDGDAVLGGVDGFYRLHLAPTPTATPSDGLYIRSIRCLQPHLSKVYGESYPQHTGSLTLPSDAYSLQVKLSGSDVARQQVLYRTRLQPMEREFTEWQTTPAREFIGLQSGDYQLDIEMLTRDDQTISRSFDIHIKTPFYRSLAAKSLYALLILLFLAYIVWRLYKREQAAKQRVAQEKNEEIRQQQMRILQLENEQTQFELKNKSRDLSTALLNEANRKEWNQDILTGLRRVMDCLNANKIVEAQGHVQNLQNRLSRNNENKVDWKRFEENFDLANNQFIERLQARYPWMTKQERKLCVYIKMGLITKEIAPLMGITVRGVEMMRYRMRSKMDLPSNTDLKQFFSEL